VLPFIDSHSETTDDPPGKVWERPMRLVRGLGGPAGPAFARVLGCSEVDRVMGSRGIPAAVVGFRVSEAVPPELVVLQGEHRFSRYELRFVISPEAVRAETRAAFPGVAGRVYRAAVIGTGAHRVLVRRMLRALAQS
jgi:hypothetical protein